MKISAYIPCYNNSAGIRLALVGLKNQTVAPDEVIVVEDGSIDETAEIARAGGAKVIQHEKNLGRGAARATAMNIAQHALVVCCDAGIVLDQQFIERALPWFEDEKMAGVYGVVTQPPARCVAERWRGRHLFQVGRAPVLRHGALFATGGAMVRKSAVHQVGNYDRRLRHSEDVELGRRLLEAGYDVVQDPQLKITCFTRNTLGQVLERFWRWNAGETESVSFREYLKNVAFAFKVMAMVDMRERDLLSVPVSLLCPHYRFWRSWWRQHNHRLGKTKTMI